MRIVYKMVGMGNNVYGRARYTDSLINKSFGGGVKKQGIPPTVGLDASVSAVYRNRVGCPCPTAYDFISNTRACSYIGKSVNTGRC
jgi:hypothetical protein